MAFRKHAINTISMYEFEFEFMWILYHALQLHVRHIETFTSIFTCTMHFCIRYFGEIMQMKAALNEWCHSYTNTTSMHLYPWGLRKNSYYMSIIYVYLAQPTLCDKIVVCEFFYVVFVCFLFSPLFSHFQMWQQLTGTMCKYEYIVNTGQIADNKRQHIYRTVPLSSLTFKQFSEANHATCEFPFECQRAYCS